MKLVAKGVAHAATFKKTFTLLLLLYVACMVKSQTPYLSNWSTNGTVYSIVADTDYVYLAGNFSSLSANSGAVARLNKNSNDYQACFPYLWGNIECVVPDGNGGWYIGGGFFIDLGWNYCASVAHILSNGQLDVSWLPNPNGPVKCIFVSDSYIYLGGSFSTVGGNSSKYLVRVNKTGGTVDGSWKPESQGPVYALAENGSYIYAGGSFSSIGGQSRQNIARLNISDASADALWSPNADGSVWSIAIDGTDIYAGGSFSNIGGQYRNRLAKLNNSTGLVDASWNASVTGSTIYRLKIAGTDLYIAGLFSSAGIQNSSGIARLNKTTATSNGSWNFNFDWIVKDFSIDDTHVYVVGGFEIINGQSFKGIARLNKTTATVDASFIYNTNGSVGAIGVNGNDIILGGYFTTIKTVEKKYLARINRKTGMPDLSWNPNPDGPVYSLAVKENDIIVGGSFGSVGGRSLNNIARLSKITGLADNLWKPNANLSVRSIFINNNDVYVGGDFSSIGGKTRQKIAKLNLGTGNADPLWNPQSNGSVRTLLVNDEYVYVGGEFTTMGGQSRAYIAKLNTTDGTADATWNPGANGVVNCLKIYGENIYAGGAFTTMGGQSRSRIAKLLASTGSPDPSWNPGANNQVYSLAINERHIFVGGSFSSIGGVSNEGIARLSTTNGTADADLHYYPAPVIYSLELSGSEMYMGGTFDQLNEYYISNFAKINIGDGIAWKGTFSSNWATPCNWSGLVMPSIDDNIIIPSTVTYPLDISDANYTAKNLWVNNGGTVILGSSSLTLTGDLSNNGSIKSTNGKVVMAGTVTQNISGNGSIENLEINNSAGVVIAGGQTNITGTLAVNEGTLTTGGFLTLKSSVAGTARVARLTGTHISGNVTVERYIPAKSARKWSCLTTAVSGNTIRNGWQDDVYITGAGTGGTICGTGGAQYNSNGFDASHFSNPSMYVYNPTPVSGSRWTSIGNPASTSLIPGVGYRITVRGQRSSSDVVCQDQLNNPIPSPPSATILSTTGTLMQGDVNIPVYGKTSYNAISGSGNAYTFIGNPYASEISLQSFFNTNNSIITSSFWFYTPKNGNNTYCTYNSATQQGLDFPEGYNNGSVPDVIIASGQAFFVERSGTADATVTFSESHKTTTPMHGNNFYKVQGAITDKLKVQLSSFTDSSLKNTIFINYVNDTTASYTAITPFDSYSFNTGNPFYLVSQKAGKALSIQTRAAFNANDTISLGIKGEAGTYKLSFSEYNDFVSASEIKLIDAFLGTEVNTRLQPEYSFSITSNTASQGTARFKIVFRSTGVLPVTGIELTGEEKPGGIQLNWLVLAEKDMKEYLIERSVDGKNFSSVGKQAAINNNSANATYTWLDAKPLNGTSYYRVKAYGKNAEVFYSKIIRMQQGKAVTIHVYPNPVSEKLSIVLSGTASGSYAYKVINAFGQLLLQQQNISAQPGTITINTASLGAGVYTLQLMNEKGDVITERFVKR